MNVEQVSTLPRENDAPDVSFTHATTRDDCVAPGPDRAQNDDEIQVVELPEPGSVDPDHPIERAVEAFRQRSRDVKRRAQAMERAAEAWPVVRADTDWERICEESDEDYADGTFLIAQLRGECALEPKRMATLLKLRQRIIKDMGIESAAESMLVDLAVVSYHNALRMQSWLEDLALLIEAECFGLDPPSARFRHHFADKLTVEDHMSRLRDVVLPMVDRANRAFIRDLMAIKQLRSVPTPVVAVEQATQVNVSDRQVNVTAQRADAGKGRARARLGRGAKGKPS